MFSFEIEVSSSLIPYDQWFRGVSSTGETIQGLAAARGREERGMIIGSCTFDGCSTLTIGPFCVEHDTALRPAFVRGRPYDATMALGSRTMKTEHAGAKNRGGYWGPRAEAKQASSRRRRRASARMIEEQKA